MRNYKFIGTFVFMASALLVAPAYAYMDVPPAVPPVAVESEELPLPEPINKAKSSENKEQEIEHDVNTDTEKTDNILGRIWQKILSTGDHEKNSKKHPYNSQLNEKSITKTSDTKAEVSVKEKYLTRILNPVEPEGDGFYVLELFTTQACPFCTKADAMMETYSALSYVIALSCHIDYFDVKQGSLSLPICSSRQNRYESFLKGASKYTPQMVINGRYDAVGYLPDKIAVAFKHAHEYPVRPLLVMPPDGETDSYKVDLPEYKEGRYHLWLVVYDMPNSLTVKGGANDGKDMVYYNRVSKAEFLGSWDGKAKELAIGSKFPESTKGFAFFVQDSDTGAVIMAGKNEI